MWRPDLDMWRHELVSRALSKPKDMDPTFIPKRSMYSHMIYIGFEVLLGSLLWGLRI